MKKILFTILILLFFICISNKVFAEDDETKLLYQDITINKDGSITVKEVTWLNGEYNGRLRDIDFKNYSATIFTGVYSNFAGNTDIYNGTGIKDIKVYDISQENFNSIEDINKEENIFKKVKDASNGKYGVYTLNESSSGADFKIFCPDTKQKVIGLEYTITDAVVVHEDVAELYWNLLGSYFKEYILDFKVLVHLPGEDSDVRIWTHGPLSGENKILDFRTLYFKDVNVEKYTDETIRIMFDKNLVPEAIKKSNVNGKEYILKYEAAMADEANAERINEILKIENQINECLFKLEENKYIFYYNRALELIGELDDDNENKIGYLEKLNSFKDLVNIQWKKDIHSSIAMMTGDNYSRLNRTNLKYLIKNIDEGFDENQKTEFYEIADKLENMLEQKEAAIRKKSRSIVISTYIVLVFIVFLVLIKVIRERYTYPGKYYRDFPNEDEPYKIEYLMKKKITNLSFGATILDLINKKVIKYEKSSTDEKDIDLILIDDSKLLTKAELIIMDILFNMVGNDNISSLKALKKYGSTESKAKKLLEKINKFQKVGEEEVIRNDYFKKNISSSLWKRIIGLHYIFSLFMSIGVFYGNSNGLMPYLLSITILYIIFKNIFSKDKNRTPIGREMYSKWLAHKRFLKDFSRFDKKDLPEITLWEKYLVTATVLGCADKVQKQMKLYITDTVDIDKDLLIYSAINNNIIKDINQSVNSAISRANYEIASSSSSGGGYGGGSSGGGGGRWPVAAVEVVSK